MVVGRVGSWGFWGLWSFAWPFVRFFFHQSRNDSAGISGRSRVSVQAPVPGSFDGCSLRVFAAARSAGAITRGWSRTQPAAFIAAFSSR